MNLITYRRPWSVMNRLQSDLDRLFEGHFAPDEAQGSVTDWIPPVDIKEEDQHFLLRADLPGVNPDDIEVTMENGVLTLRGQRIEEKRDEDSGYRRVERMVGHFYRRFTLPDTADAESITARSHNGVLEVTIPKQAKSQPRRISIDVA